MSPDPKGWQFASALAGPFAEWLYSSDVSLKPPSSKERMLALAGVWADDPTADAMIEEVYRRRKENPDPGK